MDFAKKALFKSYGVIYLAIGAAIYEVLFVFYSYPNNDTETVTFDRPIHASYCWPVRKYSPSSAVVERS